MKFIKAKENASKRTKERLKQHGSRVTILATGTVHTLQGQCILVRAAKDSWLGWFPVNEVEWR